MSDGLHIHHRRRRYYYWHHQIDSLSQLLVSLGWWSASTIESALGDDLLREMATVAALAAVAHPVDRQNTIDYSSRTCGRNADSFWSNTQHSFGTVREGRLLVLLAVSHLSQCTYCFTILGTHFTSGCLVEPVH